MLKIAMIAASALLLTGCGKVIAVNDKSMVVLDRKDRAGSFWVTVMSADGLKFDRVRIGGKRCRNGPTNIHRGDVLNLRIETVEYSPTDHRYRIDKSGLRRRFC